MGHRLRVLNQQKHLQKLADEMKQRCADKGYSDEAIVVIDYKMKFDPQYFREKTVDHYGKRGMTWHGVMVSFWQMEQTSEGTTDAVETKLYFDHIAADDNKQDKESVAAFVEAMLLTLRRDTPQVMHLVVQSDNASNYQNPFIILILPVLGWAHGIFIDRFIHSETQDGKSVLDAHFARATAKTKTWVQQGNDCTTPQELVTALTADGCLPNCVAELVQYDRGRMAAFSEQIRPTLRYFSKNVDRVNDVLYHYPNDVSAAGCRDIFDIGSCPSFITQVFAYSGVGEGRIIEVSPKCSICRRREGTDLLTPISFIESHPIQEPIDATGEADSTSDPIENDDNNEQSNFHDDVSDQISEGDSELENEVCDEEVVPPRSGVGICTGVTIVTTTQLRLRERRLNNAGRDMFLPRSTRRKNPYREKDVSAYVKRSLLELRDADRLGVVQAADLTSRLIASCSSIPASDPALVSQGWAVRPRKGNMYGAKYVKLYASHILDMFTQGENNSSEKLGPSRMLEKLKQNYPKRYNLPSENDIRGEISRLLQTRKRHRAAADSITARNAPSKKLRYRMPNHYANFLRKFVEQDPSIRPSVAVEQFRSEFPNSTRDATTDQISRKVSSLKQQAKRNHGYQSPLQNE